MSSALRVRRALFRAGCCLPALVMTLAPSVRAQSVRSLGSPVSNSACSYRTCALTIAPRWNGLAVVAGDGGPQLANLHFLVPRSVTAALVGPDPGVVGADSAAAYARRAERLRRTGAALTDAGLLLGAAAAIHAFRAHDRANRDATLAGVGGAVLLLSVPFQFAADGALSRAVWWHNLRYVR